MRLSEHAVRLCMLEGIPLWWFAWEVCKDLFKTPKMRWHVCPCDDNLVEQSLTECAHSSYLWFLLANNKNITILFSWERCERLLDWRCSLKCMQLMRACLVFVGYMIRTFAFVYWMFTTCYLWRVPWEFCACSACRKCQQRIGYDNSDSHALVIFRCLKMSQKLPGYAEPMQGSLSIAGSMASRSTYLVGIPNFFKCLVRTFRVACSFVWVVNPVLTMYN